MYTIWNQPLNEKIIVYNSFNISFLSIGWPPVTLELNTYRSNKNRGSKSVCTFDVTGFSPETGFGVETRRRCVWKSCPTDSSVYGWRSGVKPMDPWTLTDVLTGTPVYTPIKEGIWGGGYTSGGPGFPIGPNPHLSRTLRSIPRVCGKTTSSPDRTDTVTQDRVLQDVEIYSWF